MPLKINGSVNIIQGPGFAKHFLQFFSSSSRHESFAVSYAAFISKLRKCLAVSYAAHIPENTRFLFIRN